jgi:O-antigen/teichoic acid export membrane protein
MGIPVTEAGTIAPGGEQPPSHEPTTVRNAILWAYALTVGRFLTTAGVMVVLASILEPLEFGLMALAMVFVSFAQALMQHGPAQAVIQRAEVTDQHYDAAFWITFAEGVVLSAFLAGMAPLWSDINGAPELRWICWALVPAILLHAILAIPEAMLRRRMEFHALSVRILVAGLVGGVAGVAAAIAGLGVWALVIQQLLLTVISLVTILAITTWRPHWRRIGPPLRDLSRFSVHSISEFVSFFLSSRSDALLMGAFFGPVPIGLFRFAARTTDAVVEVAAGGLGQVTLPHLSRFSKDPVALSVRFGRMVHAAVLLSLPAFGVLFASAEHFLELLGPEWEPATPTLQMLCVGGSFGVIAITLGPAIQAAGRPGTNAAIGWTKAAVTTVSLVAVGIGMSGADVGAQVFAIAATFAVIHAVFVVGSIVVVFRLVLCVPSGPVLRPALPSLLSACVAVLAGAVVQPLLSDVNALVALLVTGATAACAAGAVLIMADREVSNAGKRVLGRVVGRVGPRR